MRRLIATATSIWIAALTLTSGQRPLDPRELRNHPKISYLTASVSDPVAQLNERIRQGQVRFDVEPSRGYLRSVLTALDVPVESQALVFSKTSFQASRIGPQNPRAIYFNDRVSVITRRLHLPMGYPRSSNTLSPRQRARIEPTCISISM